ncbi:MAG: hypothetical protein OXF20_07425 [Gammaproteobacteria bacterium]|nr:hypothetical protein [Gammaproteobacteria bacterium]
MKTDAFTADPIIRLMHEQTVASLPQIVEALGSPSHRTVTRKIVQAGCRSSYSHCGRYYTLDELADYDRHGLWNYRGMRFSRHGSLIDTAQRLTDLSEAGCRVDELNERVGVDAHVPLCKLSRSGRLGRVRMEGSHVYCSVEPSQRRK